MLIFYAFLHNFCCTQAYFVFSSINRVKYESRWNVLLRVYQKWHSSTFYITTQTLHNKKNTDMDYTSYIDRYL